MSAYSASSHHIETLNKVNYDTWSIQAQAILIKNNLWQQIVTKSPLEDSDEKAKYIQRDLMARSELLLLISPSELKQVKACKTAAEIWSKLQNTYESQGPARKATLLKQLVLKKMADGDDVRDHLNNFFDIVDKLQNMSVEIHAELLSIMLLYGLPASFENFRIAIETRDKLPSPDELKIKIIEESEARITKNTSKVNSDSEGAFYGKNKKKNIKCYSCNKRGHKSSDCWSKTKPKEDNKTEKRFTPRNFNIMPVCMTSAEHTKSNLWCLDSGCTSHMSGQKEKFLSVTTEDGMLKLASDSHVSKIHGKGKIKINLKNEELMLNESLYVPDLSTNLMSVARITENDHTVLFTKNKAYIKDNSGHNVLQAEKLNGLYYIKTFDDEKANHVLENEMIKWHKKLAHLNEADLKSMMRKNLAYGMKFDINNNMNDCETCIKGKMSCLPFTRNEGIKTREPLEIIHTDVCGPMQHETIAGSKYFITFIDECTRYCSVYFMKQKSEAFEKFQEFKNEVENVTKFKIKNLQSDNGKEYCNEEFNNYLKSNGIRRRLTAPYTPQQNGLAERKNRSLLEKARCMMIDANIPNTLWAEAIFTANYLINRCPAKALNGETPYIKWVGRTPSVKHLHVFGSKAFVLKKNKRQGKFDVKAKEGVFMGYAKYSKAYRIYLPKDNTVVVSRDVKVLDKMFYNKSEEVQIDEEKQTLPEAHGENKDKFMMKINNNNLPFQDSFQHLFQGDDNDDDDVNSFNEFDDTIDEFHVPEADETSVSDEEQNNINSDLPETSRRSQRARAPPVWSKDYQLGENHEETYLCESEDDVYADEWHNAIKNEIKAHIKNDTWKMTKKENNRNIVDYKMVLKDKIGPNNTVTKKARLVARGFTQRPGIDYNETYAPVVKLSSIRLLLAMSVEENLKLDHLDVTTAFLNGNLEEKIIMKKPDYLEDYITEIMIDESENEDAALFNKSKKMLEDIKNIKGDKVCQLQKALYGLKQSGRQWFMKLDKEMKNLGFFPSQADPCIYISMKGGVKTLVAVYVDDLIIAYSCKERLNEIKKTLTTKFEMKDFGKLKNCVGIEINTEEDGIKLTQKNHIEKALKKFGMENCKPVNTPIEPYMKLKKMDKCVENLPYQNLIGTLMYLAVATRPDIAYSVSYLSQFNNCYGEEHFKCAKRVLRYLQGTKDMGINLKKGNKRLYGMADADWAGCEVDRRSYSGYCFKYAGGIISWGSKKQVSVALSTAEAEYMSLTEAAKEAMHLKTLLCDMGSDQKKIIIYCDNQAAGKLSKNPVVSNKSKHIAIKQHFIRECVQRGIIDVEYMESSRMEADILTKGVPAPRLQQLRRKVGLF